MIQVPERYDVVVVGARIAGATTALLLARQGLRVLVLERGRRGADTLSTHALMRGGVFLLQRMGLLDQLVAAGTPAVTKTRFHYGGEVSTVSIKPAAGVDALYAPRRLLLDTVLIDAAQTAGAQVRFGVTVSDLSRDAFGRVNGVIGRDRSGAPVEVSAGLIVGADGMHSVVARQAGAHTEQLGTASGAAVYGYWAGLETVGYEWFYRPLSTAGLIPTNHDEVCVFAGVPSWRFAREVVGDLRGGYLRLLKEATGGADGRFDALEPPQRLHAFPGQPGHRRQPWGPGWALVGDAGYFVDPLSTHGMTDALRDAHLLAQAVYAIDHGEHETIAFAGFHATRDLITVPMFTIMDRICSYRWDLAGVRTLLLELSTAMGKEVAQLQDLAP